MVYKSLHGLAPDYLKTKFQERQATYTLRDSENKLKAPFPRTNYYKNSEQLSPEGEVDSGGYIPRREASRYI